jgi:hypothetical protein
MSSSGFRGDAAALLYLVPFGASAVYGLYLWVRSGISGLLPTSVYLQVARDPYLFIVGSFAVLIGAAVDIGGAEYEERQAKAKSTGSLLQSIAVASLILALGGAWYANGFVHISATVTDFMVARYTVIFPAVLVLLSYFITVQFKFQSLKSPKFIGVILILLVPAVVYEVGRRDTAGGLALALLLVAGGVWLLLRKAQPPAETGQQ